MQSSFCTRTRDVELPGLVLDFWAASSITDPRRVICWATTDGLTIRVRPNVAPEQYEELARELFFGDRARSIVSEAIARKLRQAEATLNESDPDLQKYADPDKDRKEAEFWAEAMRQAPAAALTFGVDEDSGVVARLQW